jgi:Putative Flp pilus-assembly TadE/G-like
MNNKSNERGQVFVLTAMAMIALVGMAALVLDVGSWFRASRRLQAAADAAALAGAQALPANPAGATQMAVSYGGNNGGGVAASDVTILSTNSANDTIAVDAKEQDPSFFATVFGINLVDIKEHAEAIVGIPSQALYVAPMVVHCNHPLIQNCNGGNTPIFNQPTSLDYSKFGAPGAFGMLDLSNSGGNVGSSTLGTWISNGYSQYLPLGNYDSDPGAKFSAQNVSGSLNGRIGTVLLFPVFDTLTMQGSNAQYHVIGWIGFHLNSVTNLSGNTATLGGYFTTYIAQGIMPPNGNGSTNFGVKSIQLIQ